MLDSGVLLVRLCPDCGSERHSHELQCENVRDGRECGWSLLEEPLRRAGTAAPAPPGPGLDATPARLCANGHVLEDGDQLCLECGAGPAGADAPASADAEPEVPADIDGWPLLRRLPAVAGEPWERFLVGREGGDALLTLYNPGAEPDTAVHDALRRMPADHVPTLFATGRFGDLAYDVVEHVSGGTLAEAGHDPGRLRLLVDELGRALASFAEAGLRHRDIRPETVLVRTPGTFDLVVTGFGSARLSDFDLEAVAPLTLTRYSAPEAIVGAVSAASDWWSLGMLALEQATAGACFEGVNDQAFRLHVVTRGIAPPAGLDPDVRLLLRGLLARDPLARWSWPQVSAWLAGETVDAPDETAPSGPEERGPALALGGREYRRPGDYAIAASEAANWTEARDLTLRGALASWLDARGADPRILSEVRRLAGDADLEADARHALAMMALNPDLPLAIAGEIVTPAWLLANPDRGYDLVTGPVSRSLERMGREPWITRLRTRAEAVRDRARLLEIELDEDWVRPALLASSRANLEAERDRLRRVFPDTEHPGLASIMERPRIPDEDLVILVGAAHAQFTPLASLADAAADLARRAAVTLDQETVPDLLVRPRREVFAMVDERTANFARCGVERVDDWADSFRIERRIALPRAAVLLSVPAAGWREPPKQQYVSDLLAHFEKRIAAGVSQGPLARFVIGRTTPRIDVAALGTLARPAEALVNHVLGRTDASLPLDPAAYAGDEDLRGRLRRLGSHAAMFRRDTGIDGRYLGFPFLLARDARARSAAVKPRIAPVFLWPVAWDLDPVGARASTLAFDREREEVRINPALEGLLGGAEFARWRAARDELLARPGLRVPDAMDVLAHLAEPRGRTLAGVPGRGTELPHGTRALVAAAALFNAEFTGQAVAEDLRELRRKPLAGTAAEVMLRVGGAAPGASDARVPERERYLTAACDPSQDDALLRSRSFPGLLVEGPPGTGKSQTIVNIVGEAIGRGESVLVICQKQAALQVVQKRLDAEGLGGRLFSVTEVNRDRDAIVRALREQLPAARGADPGTLAVLRRRREDKAARIEALEGEVDRRHRALHAGDGAGPSYRAVLGELIGVEAAGFVLDAPRLRPVLGALPEGSLSALEEACGPLAHPWLASGYEGSPLSVLLPFAVDAGVERTLAEDLAAFEAAEAARMAASGAGDGFEIEDPAAVQAWLARAGPVLDGLAPDMRERLADWLNLFRSVPGGEPGADRIAAQLGAVAAGLRTPQEAAPDVPLGAALGAVDDNGLAALLADLAAHATPPGWLGRLFPSWRALAARVDTSARQLGGEPSAPFLRRLHDAAKNEAKVRPHRRGFVNALSALRLPAEGQVLDAAGVLDGAAHLLRLLDLVRGAAALVFACPVPGACEVAVRDGTAEAWQALRERLARACVRHGLRAASRAALDPLASWFRGDWLADLEAALRRGEPTATLIGPVANRLGSLAAYQRFRSRLPGLPSEAARVFAALRQMESQLALVPEADLDGTVRRTLRREALLAVKGRLEASCPELLYERGELEAKVAALAVLDREMRALNRELLGGGLDATRLGAQAAWDDMTRLAGPRKRRLRELLDAGPELGLMHLRPVWLMNPDVASRVLPLKAGLFDLVVYDEASQMPVEHAVPTLYRARRAVVSGDEKQMPPSSFFSGSVEDDEEDEVGEADNGATETERLALEEGWNRREVKDCPDLLQLARTVLHTATLQIHYRSNYRELIGFSNAAYYGGGLSVPARQPEAEVRRARPIEVVRVDGVYAAQTNSAEAERVVDVLAGLWSRPAGECPSVGVVTFNRKQADLVEAALQARADADPAFQSALRRERERTQNGEDMGVFVKNVENVQGDERDVIVFSTTFGRDARGTFRRNFGVLGQSGGERRLNVAVTRARDKVVLVTSMPVADVSDWLSAGRTAEKPRDYLQAYLDYAAKVDAGAFDQVRATTARLAGRAAATPRAGAAARQRDGFADAVAAFLAGLGHDAVRADDAGDAFGLDFALVNPATALFGIGIECDSPRHPLLARARAREIWRPGVLGRAVPTVYRVSSRDWYQRPQHERDRLRAAVEGAVGPGRAA